jgi:AcrR family transcriptional regulator
MSESGLFAHFGSKESLQLDVLDHATERFTAEVVRPALTASRGEPRVRALFERWLARDSTEGGCPLVAAAFELDDQPGPVRERLVRDQRVWFDVLATMASLCVAEGHFRSDTDPRQFAQDIEGVLLAHHVAGRLLADPGATEVSRHCWPPPLDDSARSDSRHAAATSASTRPSTGSQVRSGPVSSISTVGAVPRSWPWSLDRTDRGRWVSRASPEAGRSRSRSPSPWRTPGSGRASAVGWSPPSPS